MAVRHNDKFGYCVNENSVLTFQFGGDSMADLEGRLFGRTPASLRTGHLVKVSGYNVLTRGVNDTEITDIRENIKSNRLLPEVIEKQVRIMYGLGLYVYRIEFDSDGKLVQRWTVRRSRSGCGRGTTAESPTTRTILHWSASADTTTSRTSS